MASVVQLQHQQVSRKRSGEQGGNGGPEKRKMAEGEVDTTKADSEDGANMSIQVQVIKQEPVSSHNHVHTGTQKDQPCCIQSVLRRDRPVRRGEAYGNLLKAGSDRTLETINVDFTGTDPNDPATEFHMEKSDDKQADALRYRSGDGDYYLKVKKSGKVNLRKLVNFPTDDKYFFHIKTIGPEYETFHTLQSLKTKEYLHCSNDGEVFMKEVKTPANGVPEDRQTWFKYMPSSQTQEPRQVLIAQDYQLGVAIALSDSESESVSGLVCETVTCTEIILDTEDSGKENCAKPEEKNSEDAQKEDLEDPEVENSEDTGKRNCKAPGQSILEQMKEGNSGELENKNLENPEV
ncbi:uncharacterized protein LOC144645161 isoform X1 [Oculina patagonica]